MKQKNPTIGSDVLAWADEQLQNDPTLAQRVEFELEQMKIGERIREFRQQAKLSQTRLAEIANTRQPVVSRIESGDQRNVTLETVLRILGSMNIDMEIRFKPRGQTGKVKSA